MNRFLTKILVDPSKTFLIDRPPAFTSGRLHLGHLRGLKVMGLLQRYHQKHGYKVVRHEGFDQHGTPTSCRVKTTMNPPDGADLRALCKKYTDACIELMLGSIEAIGESREHRWRTGSEQYLATVRRFAQAAKKQELLYWSPRATPWCPFCKTTLSDVQVGLIDLEKTQYRVTVYTAGGEFPLMTTRPDLLPFAVVVLYHPADPRYASIGSQGVLLGRTVPIRSDPTVDRLKGTGLMMVAPYGDLSDVKRLSQLGFGTPEAAVGLSPEAIAMLVDAGSLIKGPSFRGSVLAHTERANCRAPVELKTLPNLYLRITDSMKEYLKTSLGRIKFVPSCPRELFTWVENLHDWCISRQYVYGRSLRQVGFDAPADYVLDCWFESAVSFLFVTENFGAPALRFQGRQIGRTWLIYTLIAAYVLGVTLPFERCTLTNLLLGPTGKKFSKADLSAVPPLPSNEALALWSTGTLTSTDFKVGARQFRRAEFLVRKIPNLIRFFKEVVPEGPDPVAEGVKCVGAYHIGMQEGDAHKLYSLLDYLVQYPAGKEAKTLRATGILRSTRDLFVEVLEEIMQLLHA